MRSISTATALAVVFSSAALCAATAGSASATSPATVATPGGIVADGALHRVFIGDRTAGTIVAADYTGAEIDSVAGISGVSGLALSDDGSTLYAAASETHEIMALDAATLEVKARYTVANTTGPRYVAFAGGKVWFTYGDQWDGDLGSVDPAANPDGGTDGVKLGQFPQPYPGVWGPALLDTDPSQPGVLAVGETGLSTDSMAVLDVSGDTPGLTAWYDGDYSLNSGIHDIDLIPGGSRVLVNGAEKDSYAGGKFTAAGAYPSGQQADISATGLVAQASGNNVAVYRPDTTLPVRTYSTGANPAAALTWAPDSSRIFALVSSDGGYTLKAFADPTMSVPVLTVNAPSTAPRGKALTVTGKLAAVPALPAGVTLKVTRTDLDNPAGKTLASVQTQAGGAFSFTDTPPTGGDVKYTVAYAGDDTHTAVSASDTVAVTRTTPSLTLNNDGKVYDYGNTAIFTAHLGSTYKNRTVEIWANPYGSDKPNKLLKTGTVNSSGNLSVPVGMTRDTAVTAVFKGDARTAPKTVKSTGYARVNVSSKLSKYYRTGTIGSTTYYYFHKKTDVLDTTTMTYYKGRKQHLELEVYYNGTWESTDSEYVKLAADGTSVVNLGHSGESGIRARVRSSYVNDTSGDNANSTTHGAWKYFLFTN